jgi:hypothetical protein
MLMLTDNLEWWVRRFGRTRDDRPPARPAPTRHEPATPRTGRFDREAAAARREARAHDAGHTASRR